MFDLIQSGDYHALGEYIAIRASITMVCWLFMVIATLLDFWSGVTTAKALGEPLMSHGFRRTITKVSDYWRVLLFAMIFDILGAFLSFYYLPFLSMLCTMAIVIIEARSVVENSNRRRSHAGKILDVAAEIVEAKDLGKAKQLISTIVELSTLTKKHE